MVESITLILDSFQIVYDWLVGFWWLYLPVLLFFAWVVSFQNYTFLKYFSSLEWVLIEVKVPRDVSKSPKAMEQIFSALHGTHIPLKWSEKFFKGRVVDWFVFEILGRGGEIHFYVRTRRQSKNFIEAQIYAQYPDAELTEVEDYFSSMPSFLPNDEYNTWGVELILNKDNAYPIRTYPEFEEKGAGPEDIKRIDPMSSLSEALSTLEAKETVIIQLIVSPMGDKWVKDGQATVDKLMGKKAKPKEGVLTKAIFSLDEMLGGAVPKKGDKKEEKDQLSPGKQDILKAIEKKFTKLGFKTGLRFMYVGPKNDFHRIHVSAVLGAFKQFASPSLNGFKMNKLTAPIAKWPFKNQKNYKRKFILWGKLRDRAFPLKSFILNTEELATIYHFPDVSVKSPLLPRVEAKKGEPPAGLPIG